MIVQKVFLNKLKDFGLNTYESKLWTALLSRGVSTAGELSDIAGVPRSRSYDVLESLEKKGFIVMKLGKPIKYIAVPPSEVLERVKKKISEEAQKHTQMLDNLRSSEVLDELSMLHSQGIEMVEPTELTSHIKGRQNILSQFESMVKNATSSLDIITTDSGFVKKAEILKKIAKKQNPSLSIRILTQSSKKSIALAKEIEGIAQVRFTDAVEARMILGKEQGSLIMMVDHKNTHPNYDTGVMAKSQFLTESLTSLFEQAWKTAKKSE